MLSFLPLINFLSSVCLIHSVLTSGITLTYSRGLEIYDVNDISATIIDDEGMANSEAFKYIVDRIYSKTPIQCWRSLSKIICCDSS
jgi:hypothetical protein